MLIEQIGQKGMKCYIMEGGGQKEPPGPVGAAGLEVFTGRTRLIGEHFCGW